MSQAILKHYYTSNILEWGAAHKPHIGLASAGSMRVRGNMYYDEDVRATTVTQGR